MGVGTAEELQWLLSSVFLWQTSARMTRAPSTRCVDRHTELYFYYLTVQLMAVKQTAAPTVFRQVWSGPGTVSHSLGLTERWRLSLLSGFQCFLCTTSVFVGSSAAVSVPACAACCLSACSGLLLVKHLHTLGFFVHGFSWLQIRSVWKTNISSVLNTDKFLCMCNYPLYISITLDIIII